MDKSPDRRTFTVKIPKDATQEEIEAFMKEFIKNWGKDPDATEQSSKPE